MSPRGAPAFSAARAMISAVRAQQRAARGCGAHTIAFPLFTAARHLKSTVDVGFVTGMIPAITPIGAPTAAMRFGSSTHSTPSVLISSIACATNRALYRFLNTLSATTPYPVSSTASRASSSAAAAPAAAIARTIRSANSAVTPENASNAARAARAFVRASEMAMRSASASSTTDEPWATCLPYPATVT